MTPADLFVVTLALFACKGSVKQLFSVFKSKPA